MRLVFVLLMLFTQPVLAEKFDLVWAGSGELNQQTYPVSARIKKQRDAVHITIQFHKGQDYPYLILESYEIVLGSRIMLNNQMVGTYRKGSMEIHRKDEYVDLKMEFKWPYDRLFLSFEVIEKLKNIW